MPSNRASLNRSDKKDKSKKASKKKKVPRLKRYKRYKKRMRETNKKRRRSCSVSTLVQSVSDGVRSCLADGIPCSENECCTAHQGGDYTCGDQDVEMGQVQRYLPITITTFTNKLCKPCMFISVQL